MHRNTRLTPEPLVEVTQRTYPRKYHPPLDYVGGASYKPLDRRSVEALVGRKL